MSALDPTGRTMAIALCLLFACAVLEANASPSQIQRSFPSIRSSAPLGANVSNDTRVGTNLASFVLTADTPVVFVDAMKQALPWSSDRPLQTDLDGNVMVLLPGQIAQTTIVGNYPSGDYTLLYDGSGSFAILGAVAKNVGPGRMSVRINLPPNQSIRILLTKVDPNNYVRNVRLILSGFETTYVNHPFHPAFIRAMQQFHVLRFNDWTNTGTFVDTASWGNRPTVSRFSQAGPAGVAAEYQIALANATGDDPWFSIPMGATDYYIEQFAQLVHSTLDPRLHPLFEYGYQVWEPGSADNAYAQMAGTNFRLAGDRQTAALDWYSLRSAQAFTIINRVFGFDSARVTRVLSGPLGAAGSTEAALDNQILTYAGAGQYANAFAVAARVTQPIGAALPTPVRPMYRRLIQVRQPNAVLTNLGATLELAQASHLAFLAYEGPDQTAGSQGSLRSLAMNTLYNQLFYDRSLEGWHAGGGALFVTGSFNLNDRARLNGIAEYVAHHPYPHATPIANYLFVPPPTPQPEVTQHHGAFNPALIGVVVSPQRVGTKQPLPTTFRRLASSGTTTYTPGTMAGPTAMFYTVPGESGAISQQMDPSPIGVLTNETLSYKVSPNNSSWGWVSGPNEPNLTSWPATNYVVTLNITQPNASLQIVAVRIFRVNSSGGPGYNGLGLVADLENLTQSLGTAGPLTFTLAGSAQTASASDRLVVKFVMRNLGSTTESFSYDAGAGAVSGLSVGSSTSPPPSPSPSPVSGTVYEPGTTSAPTSLFYTLNGESGAVSKQMDPNPIGSLTNETLTYTTSGKGSWGWVSGPNEPNLTSWPATNYLVSLHITQPNASLQIQEVKIYRVNSSGGPGTSGLAVVGDLPNLTQNLGVGGILTFTLAGSAQTASLTDRLAVKFYVQNLGSSTQSFSYDAGVGTLSRLVVGGSPAPSPSPSPSPSPAPSSADTTTFHNNNLRTGWNSQETTLTTSNVASSNFGQVGQLKVDGNVLAQPLFVGNYQVPGQGTHNLLIVATEHNSIYAFDANSLQQIWHVNYGPSQYWSTVGCGDITPEYGITSTPVINRTGPGSGTIYFVAATYVSSVFHTQLHAVDLGTGADQKTAVEINPSALLTNGSMIHFDAHHQMSRTSLFMSNGWVYVGIGSHCDDRVTVVTGWMLRYDTSLNLLSTFNTEDDPASESLASIWMSGYASVADSSGNIFFATGNGPFDANTGGKNYGQTVVKLTPDLSTVLTWFTPADWATLNAGDTDQGAGGVMIIPGSNDIVSKGKEGRIFLLNQSNLGGMTSNDSGALQIFQDLDGTWGGPAYFSGPGGVQYVYYQSNDHALRSFTFNGSHLSLFQTATGNGGFGGSSLVVSSNGSQTGTGIVWVAQRGSTVTLQAYDATNITNPLFTHSAGTWSNNHQNPFVSPLVADGRVFVGATNTVTVFGLLH